MVTQGQQQRLFWDLHLLEMLCLIPLVDVLTVLLVYFLNKYSQGCLNDYPGERQYTEWNLIFLVICALQ